MQDEQRGCRSLRLPAGYAWKQDGNAFPARLLINSRTDRNWFGSKPIVGSSKIIRSGSCTRASREPYALLVPFGKLPQ
jgi:hypothetical protein